MDPQPLTHHPAPELPNTSTQKTTVYLFLFTSVILLLLGITLYKNIQLQAQLDAMRAELPAPGIYPTTSDSPVGALSAWKTYTDGGHVFSIQYPPDAKITSRDPDPFPVAIQIDNLKPRTGGGGGPEFEGWMIYLSEPQPNPGNMPLRQWAKEHDLLSGSADSKRVESSETPPTDVELGSLPAITWSMSGPDAALTYYLIRRTSDVILIVSHDNYGRDTDTVKRVLSTLAITGGSKEPTTCKLNGKIYNDGESFPDKCNTCSCSSGRIACTLMACAD